MLQVALGRHPVPRRRSGCEMSSGLRGRLEAEGWEERFSAAGARLEEAAEYYKSLGYEVRIEDLVDSAEDGACTTCFVGVGAEGRVGVIFTRRVRSERAPGDELFK